MMSEIKRRPKVETFAPVPEELTIKVGDKEYALPHLTYKQYKKVLKIIDLTQEQITAMSEEEGLDQTAIFYYELLKPHYPELKKSDMDDMPLYQMGAEYFLKLKVALFRTPLA